MRTFSNKRIAGLVLGSLVAVASVAAIIGPDEIGLGRAIGMKEAQQENVDLAAGNVPLAAENNSLQEKNKQAQAAEASNNEIKLAQETEAANSAKERKHIIEPDINNVLRNLAHVEGDWYDSSGNKVLSIQGGMINGCEVVGGFDFAGGAGASGVYSVRQAEGIKDIAITRIKEGMILVDRETVLRDTSSVSYFESVCGVYLGMASADVIKALGDPDETTQKGNRTALVYNNLGLKIVLEHEVAAIIEMSNKGNWALQTTGLNCSNSLDDFYRAYKLPRMPQPLTEEQRSKHFTNGAHRIAKGEYLWFDSYPETLVLSIYNT